MEPSTTELATAEKQLAKSEPSVAMMLQKVIEGGVTTENVAALEALVGLYDRMQAKEAEKQFAVAFNVVMSRLQGVKATKPVPNNDGTTRYRYAPLEEIEAQIRPIALAEGFTYYFSEGPQLEDRITKVCVVQHVGGHKRETPFTVRTSAPPKATNTQADGSTHTYAKRGCLCDAFSIVIEHDDDARMVGKPIGKALAEDLEQRVKACGADVEAFLKFAGAVDFESIPDARFEALDELLKRKEIGQGKRNEKGEYLF